jgi:hypothetical protein
MNQAIIVHNRHDVNGLVLIVTVRSAAVHLRSSAIPIDVACNRWIL